MGAVSVLRGFCRDCQQPRRFCGCPEAAAPTRPQPGRPAPERDFPRLRRSVDADDPEGREPDGRRGGWHRRPRSERGVYRKGSRWVVRVRARVAAGRKWVAPAGRRGHWRITGWKWVVLHLGTFPTRQEAVERAHAYWLQKYGLFWRWVD